MTYPGLHHLLHSHYVGVVQRFEYLGLAPCLPLVHFGVKLSPVNYFHCILLITILVERMDALEW